MQIRKARESDYDPIISVLDAWWGGRNIDFGDVDEFVE